MEFVSPNLGKSISLIRGNEFGSLKLKNGKVVCIAIHDIMRYNIKQYSEHIFCLFSCSLLIEPVQTNYNQRLYIHMYYIL